ncbi:MAG TPA: hypothetical protein VFD52_01105 [Clostridia bacterium]|nr:hypothetical protein [Clostridia bacterium]
MNNNNLTPEQLMQVAKLFKLKDQPKQNQGEMINDYLKNNVSSENTEKIKNILNDEKALNELLSSKQAQMIMKMFGKNN